MNTISNRVAVVTGGAAGIGAAICLKLAEAGAKVAIWDLRTAEAEALAAGIQRSGGQAMACTVDVSDRSHIRSALTQVRDQLGAVGILVNNAGISPEQDFIEISDAQWDRVFDVNLKGTFYCTQEVISDMISASWGRIINISSSSAQSGARRMVHYAATKGGVIAFTKSLAQEMGPYGITVNNVPPSTVLTEGLEAVKDRLEGGIEGYVKRTIPVNRVGQPEDIANAVAFLASEESGYITGLTLSVNGGRYMQ